MKNFLVVGLVALVILGGDWLLYSEPIPTRPAQGKVVYKSFGPVAHPRLMFAADDTHHWVRHAVSDWSYDGSHGFPSQILLREPGSCRLPVPDAGTKLYHVHLDRSGWETSLYNIKRRDVAKRLADAMSDVRAGETPKVHPPRSGVGMGLVDVVVTDTKQPVQLVLANHSETIWNIQLASGVKLSSVTVLSREAAGVANLPDNVPLSIPDGKALGKCGIVPARKPHTRWAVMNRKSNNYNKDSARIWRKRYAKYDNWFKRQFGASASQNYVSASRGSHVLVGPMPASLDDRFPYRPLEGSVVKLVPTGTFISGSRSHYEAAYQGVVESLLDRL